MSNSASAPPASVSASSLPPAAAAAIARPARKRSTTVSARTLSDAADIAPPPRRRSGESATPAREEDPSLAGNANLGKESVEPARGEGVSEKASLPRVSSKTAAQALDNVPRRESLPSRPRIMKLSLQAKPTGGGSGAASTSGHHLLKTLFSRSVVTFIIVAGLATTLWSWSTPKPPLRTLSLEGQVAELEEVLRKTTKMMQVQLDLVDLKIHKEVETLKKQLEEKIEEQATSFGTELRNIEARTEDIEASLKRLSEGGFPTKEDVLKLINSAVEERATEGNGEPLSLDDVRAVARRLVEVELENHAADGIGGVDYALSSGGGKVVDHSEGFYQGLAADWRHLAGSLFPGASHKHPLAHKVLEPSFGEPGQCLPLKGSNVHVEIALRTSIFPEGFSLEHVSKRVAYDISSAPKNFRVFGWLDGYKKEDAAAKSITRVLLGEFMYDVEKKSVQSFMAPNDARGKLINMVRLEVLSNYGSPSHTCIYRFRVHGSDPKAALPAMV